MVLVRVWSGGTGAKFLGPELFWSAELSVTNVEQLRFYSFFNTTDKQ